RQPDLAAQQVRKLAADRETQTGTAVLAGRAGVGLLERFEDDLLLLRRDADAGIADRELDDRRRNAEGRVIVGPAALRDAHVQPHAAVARELERVRQQVLQHLQQALRVRADRAPELRFELGRERQLARLRFVTEVALDRLAQMR